MRWRAVAAAAAAMASLVLLASCSGDGSNPEPSRSTPILGGPSGLPSGFPSGLPSASGLGVFTSGTAKLTVTGDIRQTVRLNRLGGTTIWQPPDGGMAVTFVDGNGNAFGIGGKAFTGSMKTQTLLIASMAFGEAIFGSVKGECTITLTRAEPKDLQGSIRCQNLSSAGKTVQVTGTFEASG